MDARACAYVGHTSARLASSRTGQLGMIGGCGRSEVPILTFDGAVSALVASSA